MSVWIVRRGVAEAVPDMANLDAVLTKAGAGTPGTEVAVVLAGSEKEALEVADRLAKQPGPT